MNLTEIQKRLDAQNRILNAWLALATELESETVNVEDKSELSIEVVRGNINRVCTTIATLQREQLKLVLSAQGINRSNLI
jgi:hypothetical protein